MLRPLIAKVFGQPYTAFKERRSSKRESGMSDTSTLVSPTYGPGTVVLGEFPRRGSWADAEEIELDSEDRRFSASRQPDRHNKEKQGLAPGNSSTS
jgi:hypothetical protein